MEKLARIGPATSFVFCLLGGVVMALNGIDKENALVGGLGSVYIGIAFFVGPMLWIATKK